jgi:hypothetical protein
MRFKLGASLLAATAASLVLVVSAQSDPVAAPPTVGNFAGGAVFYSVDGAISQTQFARLSVKTAPSASSVQWNFTAVPSNTAPVCTHHLGLTKVIRRNVELAFRVSSMTGTCIPNAKSYRISWLDRKRAIIELTYSDGLTASGLLRRS